MHQTIRSERAHSCEVGKAAVMDTPPRIASADLLRGKRKLIIEHGEITYILLLTRNGKLILNK